MVWKALSFFAYKVYNLSYCLGQSFMVSSVWHFTYPFFFFFLAGTLFYVNSDFVCVLSILTKLHLCSSISQCNLMCVVKENFITLTLKIFWALERSPNKYYEQRKPTQKKYRCKHTKNYMVRQQPMSTGDNKEISLTNLV